MPIKMENQPIDHGTDSPESQAPQAGKQRGVRSADVGRYVRYVIFLVVVGLAYIWNSHVAEKQVKQENKLRKEIADAKAEYKTMHARLSAGTRKPVIAAKVDSLGLEATSRNTFKLMRDQ